MQTPCRMCGGAAHPATGCAYTENFIVCRRCTIEGWAWIRNHVQGKGRRNGIAFYDHVNVIAPLVVVD